MSKGTCSCDVKALKSRFPAQRGTDRALIVVQGMGCRNCRNRVQNALVELPGVASAEVTLHPPVATVRYDSSRVSYDDLRAAISRAGGRSGHHYRPLHGWLQARNDDLSREPLADP